MQNHQLKQKKKVSRMKVNNWKQNLLPIFLMLFAFLFDGFATSYWTATLHTSVGLMVPRTILLMIILLSFHYDQNFMYWNVAIIGFVMDAYYLGFLGVYMATFLLAVTIVANLKVAIRPNVLSYTLVSIVVLTVSELVVYGIMRILGITSLAFQVFIVSRLSATLLLNSLMMLVFSFFIHRLIVNTLDEAEVR